MESAFETFRGLGAAAMVLAAVLVAVSADALLLGFILCRRAIRKRFFDRRDARSRAIREEWDAMLAGETPFHARRARKLDRTIVDGLVMERMEGAEPEEAARLLQFLRASGLLERYIGEAGEQPGWKRRQALVALGRIRAPEAVPALLKGLSDDDMQTRLAALRGLERAAFPESAEGLLEWVREYGLTVPALPLQCALIACCAKRPEVLLPYLKSTQGLLREVLARVLGEVATPALGAELLRFVDDEAGELRAAAARALGQAQPPWALDALRHLARDPIWFVRLRALISLGKIGQPTAIPTLLYGLTDSHRKVRLRAAEALVGFRGQLAAIFAQIVDNGDQYGLHAFLMALDNEGLQPLLESQLKSIGAGGEVDPEALLAALHQGSLPQEQLRPNATSFEGTACPV